MPDSISTVRRCAVLTSAFDREGEEFIGVFDSVALAKSKAEAIAGRGSWTLTIGSDHEQLPTMPPAVRYGRYEGPRQ